MAAHLIECLAGRGRGSRAIRVPLLPVTLLLLLLLFSGLPAGCTSSKVTPPHPPGQIVGPPGISPDFPDPIAAADPCAARLQDLCKPLLLYYATHAKRLPQRLDELKAFADVDTPVELTCPASGQPYEYNPTGLVSTVTAGTAAANSTRLIVYDSTPAHNGSRKAIVIRPPLPGQAPPLYAVTLTEAQFQTYVPATEPLLPAPPASQPAMERVPQRRPAVPE
jgi:hypothetical protein